jgi:hypothetical protein
MINKNKTTVIVFAKIIGRLSENRCIATKVLRQTIEPVTSSRKYPLLIFLSMFYTPAEQKQP